MPTETELARIRALMQGPPTRDPMSGLPLDYEGPSDYLDPAEQALTLPRGISSPARRGGLQDVALSSRLSDLNRPPPPQATPPLGTEAAKLEQGGVSPAAASLPGEPKMNVNFDTTDVGELAKAERGQRDSAAIASLGRIGGGLIRLIGTAAAGGAVGGAAGTAAGASSGAGFGSNFYGGLMSGGGVGAGGFLGRLSSGLLSGDTGGLEQGQLARLVQGYQNLGSGYW